MATATLIITRPETAADRFIRSLGADALTGINVIRSPLLRIVPLESDIEISPEHGAIFTSRVAVSLAGSGNGRTAYCVGAGTTEAARAAGWRAEALGNTAEALAHALAARPADQPLVHFSGTHLRHDIAKSVSNKGWKIENRAIYDQQTADLSAPALAALTSDVPSIVPLFSPRTARQFSVAADIMRSVSVIAFSPAVAENLSPSSQITCSTLPAPQIELMRAEVEMQCRNASLA